jgi:hypothetical protein
MENRTKVEEMRYNQALGYAWGAQDNSPDGLAVNGNGVDSQAFAAWYSVSITPENHKTIYHAFKVFTDLPFAEQTALGAPYTRFGYSG